MRNLRISICVAALGLLAAAAVGQDDRTVAIWPWTFEAGTKTARETAIETVRKIAEKQGFTVLSQERMHERFDVVAGTHGYDHEFKPELMAKYAVDVKARYLMYGHVKWHVRSLWVGTGPKTISTATVEANIYDTATGKVILHSRGEGRSDEKENTLKDVVDVLVTPLVTVVSGGPETPQDQRAVQIAMNRAYRHWFRDFRGGGRRR